MSIVVYCCASVIAGVFMLWGIQDGHTQTAEDILNKADAIYSGAKTYQSTYYWEDTWIDQNGKTDHVWSEMVEDKAIGTRKFVLHKVSDKPRDKKGNGFSSIVFNDGRNHYVYTPGEKYYWKITHDGYMRISTRLDTILPQLKPRKGFTYTLLAPATVNGKAAYVIEAKGSIEQITSTIFQWRKVNGHNVEAAIRPHKETEEREDLLYIDQATFHLLQRKSRSTRPDSTLNTTQIILNEILDAPIPDSAFIFVIPKGVKELGK